MINPFSKSIKTLASPQVAAPPSAVVPAVWKPDQAVRVKACQDSVNSIETQVAGWKARIEAVEAERDLARDKMLTAKTAKENALAAWALDANNPDPTANGLSAALDAAKVTFDDLEGKCAALDAAFEATGLSASLNEARTALSQAKRTAVEERLASRRATALEDVLDALSRFANDVTRERLNGENYSDDTHVHESWAMKQLPEHRILDGIRKRCGERHSGSPRTG